MIFTAKVIGTGLVEGRFTSWLWSVWLIDWLMIGVLVSFAAFCRYLWALEKRQLPGRPKKETVATLKKAERDRAIAIYGVFLVIVGAFIAYSAFRNQLKLSAEIALNQEGAGLLNYEMADPDIRCLYDSYGHHNEDQCLRTNTSSAAKWSKAIFYVEEAWFQLEKAKRERGKWGSDYAEEVRYWAEDLGRDPTGLFSYYLVSSSETVADARLEMELAGVCIPDLCERYHHARLAIPKSFQDHRDIVCLTKADRRAGTSSCPKTR